MCLHGSGSFVGLTGSNAPHFAARPALACILTVFRTILLCGSFVGFNRFTACYIQ